MSYSETERAGRPTRKLKPTRSQAARRAIRWAQGRLFGHLDKEITWAALLDIDGDGMTLRFDGWSWRFSDETVCGD